MKFLFLFITLFQLVLFLPTSSLPSSLFLEPLQPTTKLQPTNNIIPRNSLLKTINKETFSIDNSTPTPSKNTNASNAVSYEITTNNSTGESPSNEESVITNNASNISTTSTPTEGESGLIIQNSTNNESNTTIIETPQPKNSSQSKLKGESNNISNYTSNQESNEKEIEAPGTITEAHIDEVYKKGDAFLNRSSMEFIDPHGNRFDTVQYVRDLSPYAKEDIKDMNNPLKKDKALVGKYIF